MPGNVSARRCRLQPNQIDFCLRSLFECDNNKSLDKSGVPKRLKLSFSPGISSDNRDIPGSSPQIITAQPFLFLPCQNILDRSRFNIYICK
jgi:hypothetical protein